MFKNDIGIKVADIYKNNNKINLVLNFKLPKSFNDKTLSVAHGLTLLDNSNNVYYILENPYMYEIVKENNHIYDVSKNQAKLTEDIYTFGLSKELGKKLDSYHSNMPTHKNLTYVTAEEIYTVTYELDIDKNIDFSNIRILINDVMISEKTITKPDLYYSFTQWEFTK